MITAQQLKSRGQNSGELPSVGALKPGHSRLRVKESEANDGNPLAVEVQTVGLAPTERMASDTPRGWLLLTLDPVGIVSF